MKKDFLVKTGPKLLLGIFLAAWGMTISANSFADPSFSYIKNNLDGSQILTGHVPLVVKNATATFKYHASQNISAQVIMPLANQAQLNTLLQDLYNPKSPNYHQFLTPTQFTQAFAPSTVDSIQVQEFLNKEGISVTGQSSSGAVLNVTGPVRAFEQAFGLHINNYQKSDGTLFFAPDAEPTIPANLAGKILAIGGLDNLPKYMAHFHQNVNVLPKAVGSGPGGYLAPSDVETIYNLNSVTATGSGQKVALFELDGYSSTDITAYESHFGLSSVPLQNTLIDGFSGAPDCTPGEKNCTDEGSAEVTLDIELVAAFAPGSSSILVYEAPNTTQSWIDEWTKIATDNKAKVISCSWGEPELDSPTISFDNESLQQMATQGQAVFVAAGDSGAYDNGSTLSVDEPAAQPFATAVGISKLTTNSNGVYSGYTSEAASIYGGGGISTYWSIPSYQTTVVSQASSLAKVSTTKRNLPDVALTADAATGYAFYIDGSWGAWYGSSIATPIWASFISRVNQGLGSSAPIGVVNSALYQVFTQNQSACGSNVNSCDFHKITTGNNGYYPAEPGFNDATGLGSFNGLNLYNDLVNSVAVTPSITTQPASVMVTAPATATFSVVATGTPAPSYQWMQSINGGAYTAISGATSASYTTAATTTANSGTQFECVVANISGSVTSNAAILTVTSLPTVSLVAPLNNIVFTGPVSFTLTAGASETNGTISQVQFYSGTTLLYTATSSPYNYTWYNAPAGTYNFTAKATDANGVVATSSAVTVIVNSPASQPSLPTVSLVAPLNNIVFTGPVSFTLTADASETNGTISQVQFYSGTTLLYTATSSPYNYTWYNVPAGTYNFTAKATDTNGVVATSSAVTVIVNSPASQPSLPTVSLVAPLNNIVFTGPVSFTLTADASETNGTISQVQFYSGTTLLYTATSSPYNYTWYNAPAGTYNFTAKATDANGVIATSSPVTMTITSK